jgi:nucleotide-binding universal stress UspA family protein
MRVLSLRTLLAATDLTDASLHAVRIAAELARLAGARLHVVHAAAEPDAEAGRVLAGRLREVGVMPERLASVRVEREPAHAAVVRRADEVEADAIVLGPHGGDGLGSTADRVVRTAGVPCLVLPGPLRLPLGRVLAPVDLSAASRGSLLAALTWTSALRRRAAHGPGATELCVLHVAPAGDGEAAGALHREVEAVCARTVGFAGVELRESVGAGDDAAGEILRQADADGAELLVLGTRGEGAGGGELLGSVSSAVARRSRCPVLLVPPAVWRDFGGDPPLPERPARRG